MYKRPIDAYADVEKMEGSMADGPHVQSLYIAAREVATKFFFNEITHTF